MAGWSLGSRPAIPYSSGPNTPFRSVAAASTDLAGVLGARPTHAAAIPVRAAIIATSPPMLQPITTGGAPSDRANSATSAA